jgi:hypothetical protein
MAIENDVGPTAIPSSTELALDRTLLAHDRTLNPHAIFHMACEI